MELVMVHLFNIIDAMADSGFVDWHI